MYTTDLGFSAFEGCTSLEKVTILNPACNFFKDTFPAGIKTIEGYEGSTAQIIAENLGAAFSSLGIFINGPINELAYGERAAMKIFFSGDSLVFNDLVKAGVFCTGAKIAEAEVSVENLSDLPLTQNELTTTISESSLYKLSSYNSIFYEKDKPVSLVQINATFTMTEDIQNDSEELRFAFTKLIDENGNDLLADKPDHKVTIPYTLRFFRRYKPTVPTEPVTEPTEPATEPTEPATEPVSAALGNVNGDDTVNASDAAQILIAAAAMGAGGESTLTAAQMAAADVNHDGAVNASDAAVVLIYSAAVGAGQKDVSISDFVH